MADTFASKAAQSTNSSSPRTDTGEPWSRRANGSQILRRTSAAPSSVTQGSTRDTTTQNRNSSEHLGPYVPPHRTNGAASGPSYSYPKDGMLSLYQSLKESGDLERDVSDLFVPGWDPDAGNVPTSPWHRRDDQQRDVQPGVEVAWIPNGSVRPLGLTDWTAEERETFSGSVNSPIKPPVQNAAKEGATREPTHRKSSVSGVQNSPGGYGLTSPTARPGNRRRDTSEAYPFPPAQTSGNGRFPREESSTMPLPPASLLRRRTELAKDIDQDEVEKEKEKPSKAENASPFAGLKRAVTGGLATNGSWNSPSGQGGSTFSPMGGAFSNFPIGSAAATPTTADKRSGFGSMSRFKGLMKESNGEGNSPLREKTSLIGLGSYLDNAESKPPPSKSETSNPFAESKLPTGSAALQGGDDLSPPRTRGTAQRLPGISSRLSQDFQQDANQHPSRGGPGEPMSPTGTNTYQSPENNKHQSSELTNDAFQQTLPGLGGYMPGETFPGLAGFNSMKPGPGLDTVDRSGSRGPSLGQMGSLPGLGSSSTWNTMQATAGTPTRERPAPFGTAFGDGIFSPVDQPAGLGFSPSTFGNASGFGSIGRGSRIQSFLPQAMHDQTRQQDPAGLSNDRPFDPFSMPSQSGYQGLDRNMFGAGPLGGPPTREGDSPFRTGRAFPLDDMISSQNPGSVPGDNNASPIIASGTTPQQGAQGISRGPQRQGSVNSNTSSQPGPPQVRTMVMPDRMKWVYKDPDGVTRGHYSGLEMHDWYKAGYFTPELLIRKLEDREFEPLAQLIRRIGNSREPFLVPQIGVPHEPVNARGMPLGGAGGGQPPFPNSFPSFGTTLTAEQQNALERRKQEEQFLMARQKESLAQRQYMMNIGMHGNSGSSFPTPTLNHQASQQSLHSQPSFGNLASIGNFGAPGMPGPIGASPAMPGMVDTGYRGAPGMPSAGGLGMDVLSNVPEEGLNDIMSRLDMNLGSGHDGLGSLGPLGQHGNGANQAHQVAAMLNDRARLQREQSEAHKFQLSQDEYEAKYASERFQQFQDLRSDAQTEPSEYEDHEDSSFPPTKEGADAMMSSKDLLSEMERLREREQSITQQVQEAVANKGAQPMAWNRVDPVTMQPIVPPPQSSSPMPAPVAQRKQNVADTLAAGSRSRSQTPSLDTPSASIAPWAKDSNEASKGPSLKEIQEAEAKKAAQQEEIAAAARRAALEREVLAQQSTIAPAPGLPSTSTWASGAPVPNGAPVWGAKTTVKVGPPATGKKTLQQIQKEEEARKQRAAVSSTVTATAGATQILSSGKRYADLASRVTPAQPAAPGPGGAWTTVGAGGKTKAPGPALPALPGRSVSGSIATIAQQATPKPKQPIRSTTMGNARPGQVDAVEEFRKWAVKELGNHLNKGITADDFVQTLFAIGLEPEVLTEAVHYNSQTIDSRHFAEEFIRRRKLADKGVVAPDSTPALPTANASNAAGGWNEVAKKVQPQESPSNFKVVAAKKKGGRR
ncbi:hypothetical protein BT63DRAFT_440721 [Microthyrium microscopicum]|uniref:GYF domain-containing protein n=1 Tax=Microthyrium microscopicum TaxID=703497 RepID=A0A6A6UB76_9PEZI|nr:hypothetical protein BT63DRAFT_440721 [Microthyrium microscopicum]